MRANIKNLFQGRSDFDFKPVADSIIDTPMSPVRHLTIYSMTTLIFAACLWSYFGQIDVFAVSPGRIQASGRTKVVHPGKSGTISEIYVINGSKVSEGQKLLQMDSTNDEANTVNIKTKIDNFLAEEIRRNYAISVAASSAFPTDLTIVWPSSIPEVIRVREQLVFTADIRQLESAVRMLDSQITQRELERRKYSENADAQRNLIKVLKERLDMREQLNERGANSRANVLDAAQTYLTAQASLISLEGDVAETQAAVNVLKAQRMSQFDNFSAQNHDKIADNRRQIDDLQQQLVKSKSDLEYTTIRAPVSGTIQAMTVTTVGQFVQAGQEVMRVVPDQGGIEIEAYILNTDIGFVNVGQRADVKIDTFPFTRYGTMGATVVSIANDAITGAEAQQRQRDASKAASGSLQAVTAAENTQDLVFPVILMLDQNYMDIGGKEMRLLPGMTVSVDIVTDRRQIIDYLFSPVIDIGTSAFRER